MVYDPLKRACHEALNSAVRAGEVERQPCERCGHRRADAHHDDYTKPLVVRWLCRWCHSLEHGCLAMDRRRPNAPPTTAPEWVKKAYHSGVPLGSVANKVNT